MKFYEKYTGFLRSLKASYVLNNFLNSAKLQHNKELYQKYGLKKSLFSPLSSMDFQGLPGELPWLDQEGDAVAKMKAHPDFAGFPEKIQAELLKWPDNGFLILEGFFSPGETEAVNTEIDGLLKEKKVDFNYSGTKLMNAWRESPATEHIYRHELLRNIMSFLQGKRVIPFQTINFLFGSRQKAHSDFIHMTTHPKGYLIAAWTALEDIQKGSGELFYYPGSHKLPYVTTADYPSGNTAMTIGANSYKAYEKKIAAVVKENGLKKHTFLPKAGDVLVWHGNLLHGGSPVEDEKQTRRSMVGHYFSEGVICFHEITHRPALIDPAVFERD